MKTEAFMAGSVTGKVPYPEGDPENSDPDPARAHNDDMEYSLEPTTPPLNRRRIKNKTEKNPDSFGSVSRTVSRPFPLLYQPQMGNTIFNRVYQMRSLSCCKVTNYLMNIQTNRLFYLIH